MTAIDEPTDLDPRAPPSPGRPRRMLGPAFWAMIAFGFVCIAIGAVIGLYGARLFPVTTGAAVSAPPPPATATPAPVPAEPDAPPPAPAPAVPSPALTALEGRLTTVEAAHRSTVEAAAAALAVSTAAEAAANAGPFVRELDEVARLLPSSADLTALRELAVTGAPTRADLTASFPAAADQAVVRARAPAEGEGVLAKLTHALAALVSVRRVDRLTGPGVDPALARAERRLNQGDLSGALKELDKLPPAAREAMADWRLGAQRRADIDRRISAIRTSALKGLVEAGKPGDGG
jgi:hypothetical protein